MKGYRVDNIGKIGWSWDIWFLIVGGVKSKSFFS